MANLAASSVLLILWLFTLIAGSVNAQSDSEDAITSELRFDPESGIGADLTAVDESSSSSGLPVFFFHGVTANATAGFNFQKNLTGEGRTFIALDFCENACSVGGLAHQVQLAIRQIRAIIQDSDDSGSCFANGYVFIGHSQGGAIARAVIEEMDDHDVRTFVSLAGAQNGIFYGPQPSDATPTAIFAKALGPQMIPSSLMNFSLYSPSDFRGKVQFDFATKVATQASLQSELSIVNLPRSPVYQDWLSTNTFLPVINNLNSCEGDSDSEPQCLADQQRRKSNFLRLEAAHFFASPQDEVISPWQASVFGQYTEVQSAEEIETKFSALEIIPVTQTREYQEDSYGLQTLDRQGKLVLHEVAGVGHSCWVVDTIPTGSKTLCRFQPIYDQHIYPVLL